MCVCDHREPTELTDNVWSAYWKREGTFSGDFDAKKKHYIYLLVYDCGLANVCCDLCGR